MDLSSVCWWNLSGKRDATSEGPPGHLCMVCVPGEGMMRPGVCYCSSLEATLSNMGETSAQRVCRVHRAILAQCRA